MKANVKSGACRLTEMVNERLAGILVEERMISKLEVWGYSMRMKRNR